MNSLIQAPVADVLLKLHEDADKADSDYRQDLMAEVAAAGDGLQAAIESMIDRERADYRTVYEGHAEHFLSVSSAYGRFLYSCVRAVRAQRVVEFGTSMGVSTIYLAAGLKDNGGGALIGSELEAAKVVRARANLAAAGLSDLVDIREGDALQTLADVGGEVDLLLLDGAFSLYLPILRLIEPHLRSGALVLAENAFDRGYLDYVRDPVQGYLSQPVALDEGRGNELAVVTR